MRVRLVLAVVVVLATLSSFTGSAKALSRSDTCDDVAHYITAAHNGSSCTQLAADAKQLWSVTLNAPASYPIIAGGKVFVTTSSPGGSYGGSLYALDANTGKIAWGPVALGGTYYYFPMAYDNGRLFVNNFDGKIVAFDGSSGSQLWATTTAYFSGEPVATAGVVYVHSAGPVYALSEATGQIQWTSPYLDGDGSALAVDATGVYVNGGCSQFRLSLLGSILWRDNNGCTGGGGGASFLSDGLFFSVTGNAILNATDGAGRGTFAGTPAFDGGNLYIASGTTVSSETTSSLTPRFTTTLPSQIQAGPVIANGVVYVGTADSKIYGLSTATGNIVATKSLPGPPGGGGQYFGAPSDIGVGDGLLVVPTGATVTAFGGGTTGTITCTTTVTGQVRGNVIVSKGATCLDHAFVAGVVAVERGASLSAVDTTVAGPVVSFGAVAITVCGSTIDGPVEVFGSTGPVLVGAGGSGSAACPGNTIRGPVILGWLGPNFANTGGTVVGHNTVYGPVAVINNNPPAGGAAAIDANHITGPLLCVNNSPAPVNDGQPNIVTGIKYDQCAGL